MSILFGLFYDSENTGRNVPKEMYCLGPLAIDISAEVATLDGNILPLSHQELSILTLLITHPTEVLPWEFLHNAVWNHPNPQHGLEEVTAAIDSLREKVILATADSPFVLTKQETARGLGYSLSIKNG